jgi:hypothetical protein
MILHQATRIGGRAIGTVQVTPELAEHRQQLPPVLGGMGESSVILSEAFYYQGAFAVRGIVEIIIDLNRI